MRSYVELRDLFFPRDEYESCGADPLLRVIFIVITKERVDIPLEGFRGRALG